MQIHLYSVLELLGTVAFAVSGASLAIEKRFDIFGVFVLAFVTAIGGGTVRDVLIGDMPVEWMNNAVLIATISGSAALTIVFNPFIKKINYFVYLFDAVGLGIFTMTGIQKGVEADLNIFICIALGTVSATFGGLLRDIITGEKPMLLTRKEIYALASASGGVVFFALRVFHLSDAILAPLVVIVVFLIRHLTYAKGVRLPSLNEDGLWRVERKHP